VSILVTGGAGYVGGAVVDRLVARGDRVVVLDDLSRGHRDDVNEGALFVEGSMGDAPLVRSLVEAHGVEACVHLAGLICVGESVLDPLRYYGVNVGQTERLLASLTSAGVESLVYSSSAAVYGDPEEIPIPERHPLAPASPYGATKMMVERMLADLAGAGSMQSIALRYFNAAGATERIGERHDPETHLIPLAIDAALGRREPLVVFGVDYSTHDGSAIRDYVHVDDLAVAHLSALDRVGRVGGHGAVNLGTGTGHSVLEVVSAVEKVSGRAVPHRVGKRRPGDPPRLVAAIESAHELLGWQPVVADLHDIVATAWEYSASRG
jgi:UDP-glucose-4-epimerase GalE